MTDRIAARQAEVLRRVLESERLDLHTALPGIVRSYDAEAQTADIRLAVRRVIPVGDEDEEDQTEAYPILPSVPVLMPRGGGYYVALPVEVGDTVLVVFCEADLNRWRETGAVSDPGLSTRHGLSGAVAIPGLHHQGNPLADAGEGLRLGRDGGARIEIRPAEIRAGGTEALALAADVRTHLQAIATALAALETAAATTNPSPYVYSTVLAAAPIDTAILKGE